MEEKKMKKLLNLIAMLLVVVLVLAACGNGDDGADVPENGDDNGYENGENGDDNDEDGDDNGDNGDDNGDDADTAALGDDTLIVLKPSMPATLDPASGLDQPSSQVQRQIYDTLLYMSPDLELHPHLATSWEIIDASTVELELRDDVTFHNGDPLTAEDVKFSLERSAVSAYTTAVTGMIEEVEILDDYLIRIHTNVDFAPFVNHLAHTATSIVNKAHVEEVGDEGNAADPIGTGPFSFVNLVAGDSIELTRFEDYWGGTAGVENIEIRVVPEQSVRAIEVDSGAAHIAYQIAPQDISLMEESDEVEVIRNVTLSTNYIGMNNQIEPFDDVRVRQAISYALDTDTMVEAVYLGLGQPGNGPISSIVWGAADLEPRGHDIERAQELLAEAGLEDGFETTFYFNDGNPQRAMIAEVVQNQLRALNIDVSLEPVEWGTYMEVTAAGEAPMYALGWVTVTNDPDYGLFPTLHSANHGEAGNRTFFANDEVDDLLDQAREETDPDVRLQLYTEAQEIIHEEAPWIFLWEGEDAYVIHNSVGGFNPHPGGHHGLWTVTIQ